MPRYCTFLEQYDGWRAANKQRLDEEAFVVRGKSLEKSWDSPENPNEKKKTPKKPLKTKENCIFWGTGRSVLEGLEGGSEVGSDGLI